MKLRNLFAVILLTVCSIIMIESKAAVLQTHVRGWPNTKFYNWYSAGIPANLTDAVSINKTSAIDQNGEPYSWLLNSWYGSIVIPPDLAADSKIVAVSQSGYFVVLLKIDGTVTLVGLGDPSEIYCYGNLCDMPSNVKNAVAIYAGHHGCIVVHANGTISYWGWPLSGKDIPPTGLHDVIAVTFDDSNLNNLSHHFLALLSDGTVVSWGNETSATVPVGLKNDIIAISTGEGFSSVLHSDETVTLWGIIAGYPIIHPPTNLRNIVSIDAWGQNALVLTRDGTIIAFGQNTMHQTDVPFDLTDAFAISVGDNFNMAITSSELVHSAPRIIGQPNDKTAEIDSETYFAVFPAGMPPYRYQWYKNGTLIPGATHHVLYTKSVQTSDAGAYQVAVSNNNGTTMSEAATLSVPQPPTLCDVAMLALPAITIQGEIGPWYRLEWSLTEDGPWTFLDYVKVYQEKDKYWDISGVNQNRFYRMVKVH